MDLSKLDQSEKLAFISAAVVFLAGLLSNWGGLLFLSTLAALAAAVVVLLPQLAPATSLPASRGTVLAGLGALALVAAVIELVRWVEYTLDSIGRFGTLLFLVALIGSAVLAWAGWQVLQRERGTGQLSASAAPVAAPASAAPAADTSAPAAAPEEQPAATDYDPDDDRPQSG
jgi:hypothetical protein